MHRAPTVKLFERDSGMNIVCVGAHQDDIEVNCAGTLLKYRQKGEVNITIVSLSNGDKGFHNHALINQLNYFWPASCLA